jgi:hypothetical protein
MARKLTQYLPLAVYLVAASIIINVIDNVWGWNSYALWATITAMIAIGGFLMPSRPYSRRQT